MNEIIRSIESAQLKNDIPQFAVGDTVRVQVKVVEGSRERLQAFEGVVIARRNGSVRETFTVRRTSYGVGVERTFPLHSPRVDSIKVVRRGKVRRQGSSREAVLSASAQRQGSQGQGKNLISRPHFENRTRAVLVLYTRPVPTPAAGDYRFLALTSYLLPPNSPPERSSACQTTASTGIPATWRNPGGC